MKVKPLDTHPPLIGRRPNAERSCAIPLIIPARLLRRRHPVLLVLGAALVLSLFVSSCWQAAANLDALCGLQVQAERQGRLDSLLIQLVDAENGVRGYLLSRNRSYLGPYLNSLATINSTLEAIRRDTTPEPHDQQALAQLTGLVALELRILADAVATGTVGDEAPRGSGTSDGRRYMDSIRTTLGEFKASQAVQGQRSLEESIEHVQTMRWVVAVFTMGAQGLLGMLYVVLQRQFQLREQIADLLQRENAELDAKVQARTAELSELASYLTKAWEKVQARLAGELHDELGALVTAARMDVAWIERKLKPAAIAPHRERVERVRGTIERGIAMKRRITDDLRPPLLEELGLVAALRQLGDEFAKGGEMRVSLDLPDGDIDLPRDRSLALYRIAQEALTNIRRRARAREVTLALAHYPGGISLKVADDGTGFDPSAAGRHHGLVGMRHRVQMFAGEFVLDSRPGGGSTGGSGSNPPISGLPHLRRDQPTRRDDSHRSLVHNPRLQPGSPPCNLTWSSSVPAFPARVWRLPCAAAAYASPSSSRARRLPRRAGMRASTR